VKALLSSCVGATVLLVAASCLAAQGAVYQTAVAPLPDDDLASTCQYELTLPDRERNVRGIWVIFDRGRDNWFVSTASVASRADPPREMMPAAWLPTVSFARQWLSFVTQPEHPVMSLH
jgi:hypothetical protein